MTNNAATDDESWIRRALAMAQRGQNAPGSTGIGCVIVRDGALLAEAHNEVSLQHDPTAHAEMVAIRRACHALGADELRGAALYSTLQPCGMCAMACVWAKVGRVVFGAGHEQVHEMYFEGHHVDTMKFIGDAFRDDVTYTPGVLADECARLYAPPGADVPASEQGNL